MLGFEGAGLGDTEVSGLGVGKFVELYADLGEVQTGYLFIEMFGQNVYFVQIGRAHV